MGRPRKATNVLELSGRLKTNPDRRLDGEPVPSAPLSEDAPENMTSAKRDDRLGERKCYRELVRACHTDVLSEADALWVEVTARLLWQYRQNPAKFNASKLGLLMGALSKLGMSPADRSKVGTIKREKGNKFVDLLQG